MNVFHKSAAAIGVAVFITSCAQTPVTPYQPTPWSSTRSEKDGAVFSNLQSDWLHLGNYETEETMGLSTACLKGKMTLTLFTHDRMKYEPSPFVLVLFKAGYESTFLKGRIEPDGESVVIRDQKKIKPFLLSLYESDDLSVVIDRKYRDFLVAGFSLEEISKGLAETRQACRF